MSKEKKLRIIPIGGLGEVGKNMMAYEFGNDIIVVDAGIMFPDNDMLGVDYIIPDFEYLIKKDPCQLVREGEFRTTLRLFLKQTADLCDSESQLI